MVQKTLTNITMYQSESFEELYYQTLGKLMDFPVDNYINAPIEPKEDNEDNKYSKEDFLQEVVFLEKNYDQLVNLIKRKKNIILQGPPGVGKSFIAKKLAYSIMGCKDETRVEFIQFHQSYSYEDFIQGFRPVEDGFNLKNGVFYSFCRKAQDDQNNDYYFIIDEINRGNISKIFGELMMLIEEDKRGKEFAIHLTYSDTYSDKDEPKFFIPNNVYVIGMMNTADRSLAMIDYALRRRFVFYSVNPLFEEEDLFKNHLINIGLEEELAKKIISRFKTLNQKISEDDSLGDGFKIGHSYFCGQGHVNDDHESENYEDWYNSIINYEIAPLLKEYWFDNLETAQEEIDKLKIN
jgi:5-methylcytosine-specific restriction endonuclease McrBC GTP-binding regulatory subunit McrB